MTELLSPTLIARLSGASERIRRANEELDGVTAAVETYLRTIDLRIPATTTFDSPVGPCRLVFGPGGKGEEWRLTVEKLRADVDDRKTKHIEAEASWTLGEAPRPVLLAAVSEIPSLIEGIVSIATAEAERIESAVHVLRSDGGRTTEEQPTIVDRNTREKLDREFLDLYAKRMADESARVSV